MCPFQSREHGLNNVNLGVNQGHEVSIESKNLDELRELFSNH